MGKAKRAHHRLPSADGGHGARAPLPTLRFPRKRREKVRAQSNKFGVWFTAAPSIASIFNFVTTPPLAEKPPGLLPDASTRWQGTTIGHGLRPSAWPTSRDNSTPPSFLAISP